MVLIIDQGKDVCMLVWYNIWYYDIESDGIWYMIWDIESDGI